MKSAYLAAASVDHRALKSDAMDWKTETSSLLWLAVPLNGSFKQTFLPRVDRSDGFLCRRFSERCFNLRIVMWKLCGIPLDGCNSILYNSEYTL